MRRITLGFGTLLLILGFVIYQLGLLVMFRSTEFQGQLPSFLRGILPAGLMGVAMQLGGGITAIVGVIVCICGAASSYNKQILRRLEDLIETRSEERVVPMIRCRFCGAELEEQAIFCPVCNKSQR